MGEPAVNSSNQEPNQIIPEEAREYENDDYSLKRRIDDVDAEGKSPPVFFEIRNEQGFEEIGFEEEETTKDAKSELPNVESSSKLTFGTNLSADELESIKPLS
jgi:hypothetical protein